VYTIYKHSTGCQTRCQTRLTTGLTKRLYRVYKHSTGCQTGLTTGWMFVYTIQAVVIAVWQRVWQPVVSCKRGFTIMRYINLHFTYLLTYRQTDNDPYIKAEPLRLSTKNRYRGQSVSYIHNMQDRDDDSKIISTVCRNGKLKNSFFGCQFFFYVLMRSSDWMTNWRSVLCVWICDVCSLRSGGHIYYVSGRDILSLCALIDASECKPTFGARKYSESK